MTDEKTDLDRIKIEITRYGGYVVFVANWRGGTWGRKDLESRFAMPANDDQLRAFLGRMVGCLRSTAVEGSPPPGPEPEPSRQPQVTHA